MLRRLNPEPPATQPVWWLRRTDQNWLAGLALAAMIGLAGLWWLKGGADGRLVEYDELPKREVRFEIDVNHAGWPELAELPGVGPTLARRIVEHRQQHGPFQRPDDLRRVRGIGPKTLERIGPYLAPLHGPQ